MVAGASGPKERARWLSWTPGRAVFVAALAVVAAITVTPASGAADDIATGFVQAMRHLESPSRSGKAFSGTPAEIGRASCRERVYACV